MPQFRPRIGVTRWEDVPGEPIEQYWDQVRAAGGEPIDLNSEESDGERLDGLMLTGGLDVGPERYRAEPHPKTKAAERARDDYETSLLVDAVSRDLPVLAILVSRAKRSYTTRRDLTPTRGLACFWQG